MIPNKKFEDYTESEFLAFVKSIYFVENITSEAHLGRLLDYFETICEHPAGTDLLYWPEEAGMGSPENAVRIIKEWRAANGKPGFKPE